jgi:hypothetical protein
MPLQDVPLARKVTLIGIEGASMSYVLRAVAEGKLPNFARLISRGLGAARTLYPTGVPRGLDQHRHRKASRQHGLKGFYRYRFPGVRRISPSPSGLDFATSIASVWCSGAPRLRRSDGLSRSGRSERLRGRRGPRALVGSYPADEIGDSSSPSTSIGRCGEVRAAAPRT